MLYANIPLEIQNFRQWINWKYEILESGAKTKIPLNSRNGNKASVTNPLDWSSFEQACNAAQYCNGIGFVFTKSDPFCGVDLDGTKANETTIISNHNEIFHSLRSYSELSPSGTGLHIITKAVLPGSGRRRNKVEIYDCARFFTFTGQVVSKSNIEIRQSEIEKIYATLGKANDFIATANISFAQTHSDEEIYGKAATASNGAKFTTLYSGDWQRYYSNQSQSEADFALINILAFYSQNENQIVRMFQASGLGQRDKAKRKDYVLYMVKRAFDRMPPKADVDLLYNKKLELFAELGISI